MERKLILNSSHETFQAEQYATSRTSFYLWYNGKNVGYIRIRKKYVNLEFDYADLLTQEEYTELHSLIKKVQDACKKIQTELPDE